MMGNELQNRCGAARVVPGGFDSHALPPPSGFDFGLCVGTSRRSLPVADPDRAGRKSSAGTALGYAVEDVAADTQVLREKGLQSIDLPGSNAAFSCSMDVMGILTELVLDR